MESKVVVLLGFFVIPLLVDCSSADLKVNASANTGLDPKIVRTWNKTDGSNKKIGGSNLILNSTKVDLEKTAADQVGGSNEGLGVENGMDKSNSSRQSKGDDSSSEDSKGKEGGDETEKLGDGVDSNVVSSTSVRNEGTHGEECDSSNMCTIEENKLVACLRVPGNESPDLLLFIQNKGKGPFNVTIFAPDFVQLEERKVQIQEKEDKKVKVSHIDGGTDSLIMLTAGNGKCSLDFKDLIAHSSLKEFDNSPKHSFISFLTRPSFAVAFGAFLLVIVVSTLVISFRRRHLSGSDLKYQKLDMELPVSGGGKLEMDTSYGWDNNWDDVEAPKTPSMPVTPSLSSKGLASRRLIKERWKD